MNRFVLPCIATTLAVLVHAKDTENWSGPFLSLQIDGDLTTQPVSNVHPAIHDVLDLDSEGCLFTVFGG